MTQKPPFDLSQAQDLHASGDLAAAKQIYLGLLETDRQQIAALHGLGLIYLEENQLEQAQSYFAEAAAAAPDHPMLRIHWGNTVKARGLFREAEHIFLATIERWPDFAPALNNLGTLYFAEGQLDKAIHYFQLAIQHKPDYGDAHYNLGLSWQKKHNDRAALLAYEKLLACVPHRQGGRFQLGCLFMRQANYAKAIDHFLLVSPACSFYLETKMNLAACYLKLGILHQAALHYEQVLEKIPDETEVLFNLGVLYSQQGAAAKAAEYYLQAIRVNPNYYAAHYNLAMIGLMLKKKELAFTHFNEAQRLQPDNKTLSYWIHILTGNKSISAAPAEYVQSLFDYYAGHYEAHVTAVLHYQAPLLLLQMIESCCAHHEQEWDILDVGCGTGLCGAYFKPAARSLTGVDISGNMLAAAAQKNIYDRLVQAEMLDYLQSTEIRYDLVLAADVFVYAGDLAPHVAAIARVLKPAGFLAFTIEAAATEGYHVTESGRFVHSQHYITRLADQYDFKLIQSRPISLRSQEDKEVLGYIFLFQK